MILSLSRWQDGYYSLLLATHAHFDIMHNSPPEVYEVPANASELESEQAIASDEEDKVGKTPATNKKEKDVETHTTTKPVVQKQQHSQRSGRTAPTRKKQHS